MLPAPYWRHLATFWRRLFGLLVFLINFRDRSERVPRLHRASDSENAEREAEQESNESFHSGAQPVRRQAKYQPCNKHKVRPRFTNRG
jgi:hypothetical protein